MPQIELTTATLDRLKTLAVPFEDTPETIIQRILDAYDQKLSTHNGSSAQSAAAQPQSFDAISPPDLKHTKLLSAKLNGAFLREVKWNQLLVEAIRLAKRQANTNDELRRLIPVNFVTGKRDTDGYRFYSDIGLSVQGQEANIAWKGAYHIARQLGISIEAEFQWREKEGAAHPGMTGRLSA